MPALLTALFVILGAYGLSGVLGLMPVIDRWIGQPAASVRGRACAAGREAQGGTAPAPAAPTGRDNS